MTKKFTFRLCLLVHNRPVLAKLALESLLNQDFSDYEVFVSDNSNNNSFSDTIIENYATSHNLKYKYRDNQLKSIDHINQVLDESMNFDFVLLFHDDDILSKDFLSTIANLENLNDNQLAAVAINGNLIKNQIFTNKKITFYNKNIKVNTISTLLNSYFCFDEKGAPPFPGYLYSMKNIKNKRLNFNNGGKHSDLTFLIELLKSGYFLWLDETLMNYRLHENNDSKTLSENDRNSLYEYLCKENLINRKIKQDYLLMIAKERWVNKKINHLAYSIILFKYIFNVIISLRFIKILKIRIAKYLND